MKKYKKKPPKRADKSHKIGIFSVVFICANLLMHCQQCAVIKGRLQNDQNKGKEEIVEKIARNIQAT